ncbi:hypothetical protein KMZ30_07270 [Phycicoccus sp. KQZ13P-1]|uniref:hypothetical protein n=1 Tax=Phycicoccus mangrovi TaxID=2840470 RepID=UPI001C000EF9|nr:hypothetical protein [Phycicoccus mangrovi]MBT9255371.1 hypothetical protein [Phycicoccus mangrovi]
MPTALDDVRIEVSFDAPGVADPTFVDLTTRVEMSSSIGISRGQTDPFSEGVSPGRCSLVFDNTDGALTPGNPASPYYPNVRPQNRLRVTYRPSTSPGNLLGAESAAFEGGTTGEWSPAGSPAPTITSSTVRAKSGTRSMLITWNGAGFLPLVGINVPTVVGRRYAVSLQVWVPSGSPSIVPVIGGIGLGSGSTTNGQWQRLTMTWTATSGTSSVQLWPGSTATAGTQAWVDEVMVDEYVRDEVVQRTNLMLDPKATNGANPDGWTTPIAGGLTAASQYTANKDATAGSTWAVTAVVENGSATSDNFDINLRGTLGGLFGSIAYTPQNVTLGAGETQTVTFTRTLPASGVDGFRLQIASVGITDGSLKIRNIAITQGTTTTYFDGDTVAPMGTPSYRWTGPPDASTAEEYLPGFGPFTTAALPITYRFTGYVEEWPLVWPDGGQERALSPVVAYDIVSRLSRAPEFRSVIEETLDLTGRVWHYPLSEGSESITAGDVVGNGSAPLTLRTIGTGSTVTFGGGTGPDTDGSTAVSFAGATPGNSTYLTTTLNAENLAAPPPNFGLTYFCTFASETAAAQTVMYAKDPYGASVEIGVSATGYVYGTIVFPWGAWLGTGVVKTVRTTPTSFLNGKTHVVELSIDDNGTGFGQTRMRLYVDGTLADTLTWSGWYGIAPTNLDVGLGFTGTISHVALLSTGIDATTAASHNAACTTGFAGENTGTRISRALDWAGVPTALRNIGVGASGVDHIDPRGMTPWTYIALVANTEGGLAAADTLGRVWFRDRTAGYDTAQAVAVTASSDDLGGGVEVRTGLDSIANDVRVTRQRGASSRAADATSIDTFGAFGYDLTIACPTDREAYDRATWVLAIRGTPAPTIPSLDLDGLTGDAAPAVRQIDLDDRIAVSSFPSQVPASASLSDLRVYGYTESIGSSGWSVSANTGTFLYIRPMIADDDVYGLADGDNRAVY